MKPQVVETGLLLPNVIIYHRQKDKKKVSLLTSTLLKKTNSETLNFAISKYEG